MTYPDWMRGVHHDSSARYVSNPLPALGETVTIRLRVPASASIRRIYLRSLPDGEIHHTEMRLVHRDAVCAWWEAPLTISMPRNPYRFKVFTDSSAYYVNALGISRVENIDYYDFKLLANYAASVWVNESVFYQIFVDRFHNGDPTNDPADGAWELGGFRVQRRAWGLPPLPWREGGNLDFYGGDLAGIVQKLDYLTELGINTLYLTPIFTALSNHRYDTLDFDHIDPAVGGDAALADLRRALDARQMRLVLDVVVNHVGSEHPWFKAALVDANAPSGSYFTFYRHPDHYESWLGYKTLVKLNYGSAPLRDVLYRQRDSVLRRWLHEPYRIDGWRMDVFHMMGRQRDQRYETEVAREIRRAIKGDNPSALVLAEHSYDASPHLQGDELDATMNYLGFAVPLRRWLTTVRHSAPEWGEALANPDRIPASALAEQWANFRAPVPYALALQQYNFLSSHDINRIVTALNGDRGLHKVAAALLFTYPGVPGIYYGDEIGLAGDHDPDNRRCMIWDESAWDADLRADYRALIHLRRSSPALAHGGFQLLETGEDCIAYLRDTQDQQVITAACRVGYTGAWQISAWLAGIADGVTLRDALIGERVIVKDGRITLPPTDTARAWVLVTE